MVDYETTVEQDYLEKRKLKRFVRPLLLGGLGVGYVISCDYFGGNFDIGAGVFGGLLVVTILMGIVYTLLLSLFYY